MNDAYTLVSGKDIKTDKKTSRGKVKAKKNSEAKAKAAAKARAKAKKKAEAKAKAAAKAKAKNNTGKKASGAVNGKNKINNHILELDIQYFAKKSKPKASSTSKAKTNTGKKAGGADKLLKPDLLDELSKSGVKYNPDDVVMVGKKFFR